MTTVISDSSVVVKEQPSVTVVSAAPQFVVTELTPEVKVVTARKEMSVVSLENGPSVVPVNQAVTVITNENGYVGPHIFVQSEPPSGASTGDVWIRTA